VSGGGSVDADADRRRHHPRACPISVSAVCSIGQSLVDDLELWGRHGVRRVSIPAAKLGPGDAGRIADAGLHVESVLGLGSPFDDPARWPAYRDGIRRLFDAAQAVEARFVALTTGSAGQLAWAEAAEVFGELMSPLLCHAPAPVIVEHTNQLRSDISFVHRLRDAVDLGRPLGLGVLLESTACWQERGLFDTITEEIGAIRLVHMSDLGPVVRASPDRLVPGDGVVPLVRMAASLLAAGYAGAFELEYAGPRIEAMGYDAALARGLPALRRLVAEATAASDTPTAGAARAPAAPDRRADCDERTGSR